MSDDDDDTQEAAPPSKRKGVDLASLNEQLKAQGYDGGAMKKAVEDMQRQLEPLRHIHDQMKGLQGLAGHEGIAKQLAEQTERYSAIQEQMERALGPYRDLQERMKHLGVSAGEDSAIGRVAKQISDQQRAIDAMRPDVSATLGSPEPPRMPRIDQIKFPPNPLFETNERLQRIEERFEQMQDIATDAAQIANGLQGAAAEFLQKFEKAAQDNDRTAGRAIWIGVVAVVIAIAMPAVQIGYSEFRRVPDNGPEIQVALEGMQAELTSLREAQAEALGQLGSAINSSNSETAAILREIRDLLSEPAAPVMSAPDEPPQ